MLRTRTLTYLLALSLGTGAAFTTISTFDDHVAEAKTKAKAKKKPKKAKVKKAKASSTDLSAEQKKARAELIGSFQFGMTKDQVVEAFGKQLDDRYADLIAGTEDVAKQDQLRKDKGKELDRFKKSYIEFTGKKSGWDVSIVDEQFRQGTDESMLVEWENQGGKNQRRFFFFHEGELYKMFIQIDTNQFEGDDATFDSFSAGMKTRYGAKVWDAGEKSFGGEGDVVVRALDKSRFYDAFCLIAFDPKRAKDVAEIRAERIKPDTGDDSMTKSITDDGTSAPSLDDNKGAVNDAINASGGDKTKKKKGL